MKKGKKNSDCYYLSNRKMIEVVFSSRVSLLVFSLDEKTDLLLWQIWSKSSANATFA